MSARAPRPVRSRSRLRPFVVLTLVLLAVAVLRRRRATTAGQTAEPLTLGPVGEAPLPEPSLLPRPVLWPDPLPGSQPRGFASQEDPRPGRREPSRARVVRTWGAVAAMVLGAALVGLAVVLTNWLLVVAGVVVGLAGAVVALRSGVLEDVE